MYFSEMLGQRLCESSRSAPEVKRFLKVQVDAKCGDSLQRFLNAVLAGFKKFRLAPPAALFVGVCQDRPEGIFPAKLIPRLSDLAPDPRGSRLLGVLRAYFLIHCQCLLSRPLP